MKIGRVITAILLVLLCSVGTTASPNTTQFQLNDAPGYRGDDFSRLTYFSSASWNDLQDILAEIDPSFVCRFQTLTAPEFETIFSREQPPAEDPKLSELATLFIRAP